jgi:hypothetical protein
MANPYAPPAALVEDIADPSAVLESADRGTRLVAAILDGIIGGHDGLPAAHRRISDRGVPLQDQRARESAALNAAMTAIIIGLVLRLSA